MIICYVIELREKKIVVFKFTILAFNYMYCDIIDILIKVTL